jgi:tetratricopeptide (TPR) repeat protein
VDALNAAASDPRPGTVRLSGAPYQEPEPVLRGGAEETPRWKLLAAAERVREQAAADPSARNLHALGIAHLLLGEGAAAVEQLERARRADPLDGRIASDLGAALISRGLGEDTPEDVAAGLDLLLGKRAEALTLEDRFNRALALDRLGMRDEAIAEWERYLELDRESAWATEARERLEGVRKDAAAEPL